MKRPEFAGPFVGWRNTNARAGGNMSADEEIDYWPCPLCGKMTPIKSTHKLKPKPYANFECHGIQMFWRGQEGIDELRIQLENGTEHWRAK
jgi:hypothetical protein